MLDGQIAMLENAIVRFGISGVVPEPMGSRHPTIVPFAAFKTGEGHIIIAAGNDDLWAKLATVLAAPELITDARFLTNPLRCQHWSDVQAALEKILVARTGAQWIATLEAAGVPCGPINNVAQAMADPQVRARNMIVQSALEDGSPIEIAGTPVKFSAHPDPATRRRAPKLDEQRGLILDGLGSGFLDDAARLAHCMADASGIIIRQYFRQPMTVDAKDDLSPVTRADREAESRIRDMIARDYPGHGIIGEEFGAHNDTAEFVWVIDPIDGTRSFIAGRPLFGTLIALLHNNVPVLGIIDQPIAADRWIGVAGRQTMFNGAPCAVRPCIDLSKATIATTGPQYFRPDELVTFNALAAQFSNVLYGGDCHNYGLLASGNIDFVMEAGLKLHDWAALVPVVTGAGGTMTDWQGLALTRMGRGQVLARGESSTAPEA
jgi:inositol-phosphate phosphatase / L-galactose 1-phosphate phosphatase / histidinol-phosphatase